ncbi:15908_t:CDS:2, partial [Gigaspora rosea]
ASDNNESEDKQEQASDNNESEDKQEQASDNNESEEIYFIVKLRKSITTLFGSLLSLKSFLFKSKLDILDEYYDKEKKLNIIRNKIHWDVAEQIQRQNETVKNGRHLLLDRMKNILKDVPVNDNSSAARFFKEWIEEQEKDISDDIAIGAIGNESSEENSENVNRQQNELLEERSSEDIIFNDEIRQLAIDRYTICNYKDFELEEAIFRPQLFFMKKMVENMRYMMIFRLMW